jgi:hypothetical protein
MSAAERAYRLLLRAYPAAFRARYGREMELIFGDQRREANTSDVRLWVETVLDVARSAPALRLEHWCARWNGNSQPREGEMKVMAILTVLIGALEALNAVGEGWAGGLFKGGGHDGYWVAGVILAVVAGVVLLMAGIAMLRRTRSATTWAQSAAVICLSLVVLIRLMQGWMSGFSMLLGIAFPIALVIFLRVSPGRGKSTTTMA